MTFFENLLKKPATLFYFTAPATCRQGKSGNIDILDIWNTVSDVGSDERWPVKNAQLQCDSEAVEDNTRQ